MTRRVSISRARASSAADLVDLWTAAFHEGADDTEPRAMQERLASTLRRTDVRVLLGRMGPDAVGVAALVEVDGTGLWPGKRLLLERLYVHPTARGRGVGTELMAAAQSHADRVGSSLIGGPDSGIVTSASGTRGLRGRRVRRAEEPRGSRRAALARMVIDRRRSRLAQPRIPRTS